MDTNLLLTHIENHFGKITSSWALNKAESHLQVLSFSDVPAKSISAFVTLGLSSHLLTTSVTMRVRQELVFTAHQRFDPERIASMLLTFSTFLIRKHEAVLRGSVECSEMPIIPDVILNCLYATIPVIFPDSLDVFRLTTPPTVFVWLIPLHKIEAEFIKLKGWSRFEEVLENSSPDLFNLRRAPIEL